MVSIRFSSVFLAIACILLTSATAQTHLAAKPHKKILRRAGNRHYSGGQFLMGNNSGEPDERPQHAITLDTFKIDAHEVTNAQFEQCVKAGVCAPAHYDDNTCNVMTPTGWWEGVAPTVFQGRRQARGVHQLV